MKISYSWLQTYFEQNLPSPDELADLLTFHSFELEGTEKVGNDVILDIDVLPNRSSDCLCHRGIAREVATITGLSLVSDPYQKEIPSFQPSQTLKLSIDADKLVNRFSTVVMTGIEVQESPEWLRMYLETIGQKSINNVVDATNYVMFNLGQPLHAFDQDKMGSILSVRMGNNDEKITTLTNDEYIVGPENVLIVDKESDEPLAIAGVKGGKKAEVDENTKNIVLEAANFNFVSVRKTSSKLKLITDASVRFQNEPSPYLTMYALRDVTKIIKEIAGGDIEGMCDWYPNPSQHKPVSVTVEQCNAVLGTSLTDNDVESTLARFGWEYQSRDATYEVTPPFERADIHISEDLVEEIGRVSGYRSITSQQLPALQKVPEINKRFYYAEVVRRTLVNCGFSEIYSYTLKDKGDVELLNALASDKAFMREDLMDGMQTALVSNTYNAPLLGLDQIKLFEIGTVFKKEKEHWALSLGVKFQKKIKGVHPDDVVRETLQVLSDTVGTDFESKIVNGIVELHFDKLLEKLPDPTTNDDLPTVSENTSKLYQPFSIYPFALRDIAVWVDAETTEAELSQVIRESAGDILVRLDQFDRFEKEGRISYAYHLVFQSSEKTLSDDEILMSMQSIEEAFKKRGWEIR